MIEGEVVSKFTYEGRYYGDIEIIKKGFAKCKCIKIGDYDIRDFYNCGYNIQCNCYPTYDFLTVLGLSFWISSWESHIQFYLRESGSINKIRLWDEYNELNRFQYMTRYGVDLDKIQFMSRKEFMERFFEKVWSLGNVS